MTLYKQVRSNKHLIILCQINNREKEKQGMYRLDHRLYRYLLPK